MRPHRDTLAAAACLLLSIPCAAQNLDDNIRQRLDAFTPGQRKLYESAFCRVINGDAASLSEYQQFATYLRYQFPGWDRALPDCPCSVKCADNDPSFKSRFFIDGTVAQHYHPGADKCYRSTPVPTPFRLLAEPVFHGQQCCYDKEGSLIRTGEGAGTPDFWSDQKSFTGHRRFDVLPFESMGWRLYTVYWPPNAGTNSCAAGPWIKVHAKSRLDTRLNVTAGGTHLRIRVKCDGQISWNRFLGFKSSPLGTDARRYVGYIKPPVTFSDRDHTGALIGTIFDPATNKMTGSFLIGLGGDFVMPSSGRLYLQINDAVLWNNDGAFEATFEDISNLPPPLTPAPIKPAAPLTACAP